MGKNFNFEIFDLKYVLKHSELIQTKKDFDKNFHFVIFLPFLAQKSRFLTILDRKFFLKKIIRPLKHFITKI